MFRILAMTTEYSTLANYWTKLNTNNIAAATRRQISFAEKDRIASLNLDGKSLSDIYNMAGRSRSLAQLVVA